MASKQTNKKLKTRKHLGLHLHCSLAEPYTHIPGEGEDHLTPTGKIDLGAGSKTWKTGCELASEFLTSLPSASPANQDSKDGDARLWQKVGGTEGFQQECSLLLST